MNIESRNKINLIRALSGQQNVYCIPKLYVRLTECHSRALVLNQLIFYSDKSTRHQDGWFDKTYKEWEKETFLKERTLRNILTEFSQRGWCERKVIKVYGNVTLAYRPILENILADLEALLEEDLSMERDAIVNPAPCIQDKPIRQNLPDHRTAKFAGSSIYTDKTTDNKTTNYKTEPAPSKSSSSFFKQGIECEILKYKLVDDSRTDEEFLEEVNHHVENNSYKNEPYSKRQRLAIRLLKKLFDMKEIFKSSGFVSKKQQKERDEMEAHAKMRQEYRAYLSVFFNDRDFLKIPSVQGMQPLFYEDWIKNGCVEDGFSQIALQTAQYHHKAILSPNATI